MENHEIYSQIFIPQAADQTVEEFLMDKRALFGMLNPRHPETTELDMLYGFLLPEIQANISRQEISTYNDLLTLAKPVETKDSKERCTKCHKYGHSEAECDSENAPTDRQHLPPPQFPKRLPSTTTPELPHVSLTQVDGLSSTNVFHNSRPGLVFEAAGRSETAVLNMSANVNIASVELYQHLKKNGYVFREMTANVNDYMSTRVTFALVAEVDILLEGYKFDIQFVVFQDVKYKKTILGYTFIKEADIWMHLGKGGMWMWGFSFTPKDNGFQGAPIDPDDDEENPIGYLSVSLS